ncbi:hypothetical protein Tco_0348871 [Tanacetum coccineum]
MLDDLDLLSQLERDVIANLNAGNEYRKRRMYDFEAPSFDLVFPRSNLKNMKQKATILKPKFEIHAGRTDLWSHKLNEEEGVIPYNTTQALFLLCFDLKYDCYYIKDNSATGDIFKYENVPIKLVTPKCINDDSCMPCKLEMAWRTTNNDKYCGVFLMRHMETYEGTSLASWNTGLKPEGDGKNAQLDDIWKKYVTRLLVWKNNMLQVKVLAEADIYDRLKPEKKT